MSTGSWRDEVRRAVERTCAEQGVPVHITDRTVVDQVVVLLRGVGAGGGAQARSAAPPPAPARSVSPGRMDTLDRDVSGSHGPGSDHDVVDQRLDDGALTVEVERGPLSA
jgi:hypothetical protein